MLNGARQVGKTWLLKEFGARHFESVAYVNLDNNLGLASQFDVGYDLPRILLMIQAESGQRVIPGKTLVVLDEVQECPKALTSLKYFCENAPELAVAAAGSLLGITFHEGTGYPVGKVDMLDLHPLSFREFLHAIGSDSLAGLLNTGDANTVSSFLSRFVPLLKRCY